MTPDVVPIEFERTMGCTAAELCAWLLPALPDCALTIDESAGKARAMMHDGSLDLTWHALPPRRIALLQIPCLAVVFRYHGLNPARRHEVQVRFDRATQRGGG